MEFSPSALFSKVLEDLGLPESELQLPVQNANNPREAACRSLYQSFFKKLESDRTENADSAALLKFLESNFRSKSWVLNLNTSHDEELFGELKRSIDNFWHREGLPLVSTDLQPLFFGRCGPGAARGSPGESTYAKLFSSRMAVTRPSLYSSYKDYISKFEYWKEAEETRLLHFGLPDVIESSRLDFVPKTDSISRCICIEPSLNMFFQLGLGQIICDRLYEYFGIDMEDQQFRNRDMARIGSIFDSHVTIDLSSASDSIGLNLCREILPKSLLNLLERYRCRSTEIPGLGSYELDIISSMGNGFTFPLQTMIFSAMIEASFHCAGVRFKTSRSHKSWGCFGDDLIVPRGIIERNLRRLLHLCGFVENPDKTFSEGPFRESCGADYFLGIDVRGVYIRSLNTVQDFYVAINRLNLFSARTSVRLSRAVQYLLCFVPKLQVPMHENDDAGIRMPLALAKTFGQSSLPINGNGSVLYHAYRPITRKLRFLEDRIIVPRFARRKGYIFNPLGAFVCFLDRKSVV